MIYVIGYFVIGIMVGAIAGIGLHLYLRKMYHPAKLKAIMGQLDENENGLENPFDIVFATLAWPLTIAQTVRETARSVKMLGGRNYFW